jgi:uncharacterized membrane protein
MWTSATRHGQHLGWVLLVGLAMAGCRSDPVTGPRENATLARGGGGKPAGGGGTLLPLVKLADPRALGCSSITPRDLSPKIGGNVVRVAGSGSCGGVSRMFSWSPNDGGVLIGNDQGQLLSVADDGGMAGVRYNSDRTVMRAFVSSQAPSETDDLPSKGPGLRTNVQASSPDGGTVIGQAESSQGGGNWPVVIWRRSNGTWSGPVELAVPTPGWYRDISLAGERIVGARSGPHAAVWSRQGEGWTYTALPEKVNESETVSVSDAQAINAAGDLIVGYRDLPVPRDPGSQYDEHVVWRLSNGSWVLEPLVGLNISEGIPSDVADLKDGRTVVVGYSWEDTNGKGGIRWPVYWVWNRADSDACADGHCFGPAQKLSQLNERWGAEALAVNIFGQIVGTAWTGSVSTAFYPVMWTLPVP